MRARLGLDPYANTAADRPMVLTATGYVPIEANAVGNASGEAEDTTGQGQEVKTDAQRPDASIVKAAADDPKHPGWPAGAPGGIGGQFRPKDSDAAAESVEKPDSVANPSEQYAANDEDRGAANDNRTPEQTCQRAYDDAVAYVRMNSLLSPTEYPIERRQISQSLHDCLDLVHGNSPIGSVASFVFFHGGGIVVFREGRPPLYGRPMRGP